MDDIRETAFQPPQAYSAAHCKAAYLKHRESFMAMRSVLPITVDIPKLFTRTLGVLRRLGPLREEALSMPRVDRALGELTEEYLYALGYTQALYYARFRPANVVRTQYAELLVRREKLVVGAAALAMHDLIPRERRVEVAGTASRAVICLDTLGLATQLQDYWPRIEGKTAITRAELEGVSALADEILTAIGARATEGADDIIHVRQAAFTMFVRAYDQLRRGVSHIRWDEGDLEKILPTPYTGRTRPKAPEDTTNAPAPGPAPLLPANENPGPPEPDADWPFEEK